MYTAEMQDKFIRVIDSQNEAPQPTPICMADVFRDTVTRHSQRIAVIDGEFRWPYETLDKHADSYALKLQRLGICHGDRVGIWATRSAECLAAMLGILKCGAAYVPLDAEFPLQRITDSLSDCSAKVIIVDAALAAQITGFSLPRIVLGATTGGQGWTEGSEGSPGGLSEQPKGQRGDLPTGIPLPLGTSQGIRSEADRTTGHGDRELDYLAYIIYTSGTTGRPKGVPVSHRNIWHLVEAEAALFRITPDDRVFHGFSIAFDASLEEIWMAFRSGAALVIGSTELMRSGPQLADFLTQHSVTVLSCVPTLLMMMERDFPTLRLLIVGGEACSAEIVRRWAIPGRRMVNTYGPTETTVVATWADVTPDLPVRIGRGLPGWTTYVVDDQLAPVKDNTPGELLIGGRGVVCGYLNRPELTAEKFVKLPWCDERLYRTGDLVRLDADGQLEFLGRIDQQVKLRGFRIELGEIEAVLMSIPGIAASAVTVHRDLADGDLLAAYVILKSQISGDFDEAACRKTLRDRLPPYMIPGSFTVLDSLPTLSSGKLDRNSLPHPDRSVMSALVLVAPPDFTHTEVAVWEYWHRLFPGNVIDRNDSFFDLGGQSLLATKLVSEMRTRLEWSSLSVMELYRSPTLAAFAARLDELTALRKAKLSEASLASTQQTESAQKHQAIESVAVRSGRHFCCGFAQLSAIYILLIFTLPYWFPIFTVWDILVERDSEHQLFIALIFGTSLFYLLLPMQLAMSLAVKWLVIGRCKPGRYRVWGTYYFRFWFVQQVTRLFPTSHLRGMPWLNVYFRLMGAKIGNHVHLATDEFVAFDLLSIGDETSIEHDAVLSTATVEGGWLILGRIDIGSRCHVGSRAWLGLGSRMDDESELDDGAMLPPGSIIGAGERWFGSPARPVPNNPEEIDYERPSQLYDWPPQPAPQTNSTAVLNTGYAMGIVVLSLFPTIAVLPGAFLLGYIDTHFCDFTIGYRDLWKVVLALPFATALHVIVQTMMIAATKWILIGRLKEGVRSVHSLWYVRKWLVDALMHLSLDQLFPMYSTIYLIPWLRLLGAKLGKNVEVSTVEGWNPDLVKLDDGVFVADAVCLGPSVVRRGWSLVRSVSVGKNSFLGNSAMIPGGTHLGDKTLIGVLSKSPNDPADAARVDASWLGIPAMFLPHRDINTDFDKETTYAPSLRLRILRAVIEFCRVILPESLVVLTVFMAFQFASDILHHGAVSDVTFLLVFPLLIGLAGVASMAITVVLKWLIIGRYTAQERPLWSTFVWRSEFVNCLHEHLAMPMFGAFILGTPALPFYFRLLGAKIGRRCLMDSANLTEFDLVKLGNESMLNNNCDPQTHLFEDRVMKMSYVQIGNGCSVGSRSVVLYDAKLSDNTTVLGNSLVMKGEHLPPNSRWYGSPAQRLDSEPGL